MNWQNDLPKFKGVDEDGNKWEMFFDINPVWRNKSRLMLNFNDMEFHLKTFPVKTKALKMAEELIESSNNLKDINHATNVN